jgi:hypothetical protein
MVPLLHTPVAGKLASVVPAYGQHELLSEQHGQQTPIQLVAYWHQISAHQHSQQLKELSQEQKQ